jgi:hypothetical protein
MTPQPLIISIPHRATSSGSSVDKTPRSAKQREELGEGKPEPFDFLGFTHFCTRSRKWGSFVIGRKTIKKRMLKQLQAVKMELRVRESAGRWSFDERGGATESPSDLVWGTEGRQGFPSRGWRRNNALTLRAAPATDLFLCSSRPGPRIVCWHPSTSHES